MAKSLYIHIPFCNHICSYCDFPKVFSDGQDIDAYLTALIAELEIYEKKIGFEKLQTVYIGGGTPTVLTIAQLERLFVYLHAVIDFRGLMEVSIEANPESLNDIEKVACLKKSGVTRVSLGVQTFQENHLRILERSHAKKDVEEVVHLLADRGFEINLDMIYAIPTQTIKDWEKDLDRLLELPITHVSAYSLILEGHTKFHINYMKDQLKLVDNEVEARMFELVINKLTGAGFDHYEISNFTRSKPSVHNMTYWKNDYYIGVGLGAHGHIENQLHVEDHLNTMEANIAQEIITGPEATGSLSKEYDNDCLRQHELCDEAVFSSHSRAMRYENTRSINAYKKTLEAGELPVLSSHVLSEETHIEESMFLGLRLMTGINFTVLNARYHQNVFELYRERIEKLRKLDYVNLEADILKLTQKGLMMANDVFEEFLL